MLHSLLAVVFFVVAAGESGGTRIDRPDPVGTPTTVHYGMFLADVAAIDSAQQNFTADLAVVLRWRDPRLKKAGSGRRAMEIKEIWHPGLYVLNQRNIDKMLEEMAEVEEDGTVTFRQRYSGQFTSPIRVADFPFDEHDFQIRFISARQFGGELNFTNEVLKDRTGIADQLTVADWRVTSWRAGSEAYHPRLLTQSRDGVVFTFHAKRQSGFYVFKMLLPLGLIVFMSWVVFWVDPVRVDAQLGLAATAVLTMIAYRLSFDNLLPPVSYLTRIDYFLSGCTALIFLSMFEVVFTGTLVSKNRPDLALRIDRWSRAIFPIVYALLIVFTLFV
ncbi:MAG TPA: hypothetical protein VNC50_17585 [Planctomycetia bacterium]|nr:hypothetical protein [Planctomycetia bacterium]